MRIAIFGAGGVGGYFGGRLALAGNDVTFIARGAHLEAMRLRGLRVESSGGDFTIASARATDDPSTIGVVDVAIVAVKTWQLPDAASAMRPMVGDHTVVLPLLNGIEANDQLDEVLGRGHTLGGLCRIIASIAESGLIRHVGMDPVVMIGEMDNQRTPRVEQLRETLTAARINANIAPDIRAALWEKFMFIAAFGALGAVTRAPVGVWRSLPGTRAMAEALLRETWSVARALGVDLAEERIASTMTFFDGIIPDGTASMQRDMTAGKPSELESMSGAVVRLGAAAGVPTPTHSFFYNSLLPQERAARGTKESHA